MRQMNAAVSEYGFPNYGVDFTKHEMCLKRQQETDASLEQPQKTGIELKLGFFPLAFILFLCRPVVVIDGFMSERSWGTHFFPIKPGRHKVNVYFEYLFFSQCGANTISVMVSEGEVNRIKYYMWPWVFAKGSLWSESSEGEGIKHIDFWLWMGIFFMPYIFAWITLRSGYSNRTRTISFIWLCCIIVMFFVDK